MTTDTQQPRRGERRKRMWSMGFLGVTMLIGGVLMTGVASLLIFGPAAEAALWPVLTDVRFALVARSGNRMTLDWSGTKTRDTCAIVGLSALVRRGGVWVAADLVSLAEDADGRPLAPITRPSGRQQFRRMDIVPNGDGFVLLLRHRCHPLWETVTRIGSAPLVNAPINY